MGPSAGAVALRATAAAAAAPAWLVLAATTRMWQIPLCPINGRSNQTNVSYVKERQIHFKELYDTDC